MSLLTGLVSYYSLDGNSLDAHGVSNGTDTAITYVAGKLSSAAGGVGAGKIDISGTDLNLTGDMSISAWIYRSSGGNWHFIVSRGVGGGGVLSTYEFRVSSSSTLDFLIAGLGVSAGFVPVGAWTHVVGTRTGTYSLSIYINAVPTGTSGIGTVPSDLPLQTTIIGARDDGFAGGLGVAGFAVDEVGIWNRALSPAEVTELYNAGVGIAYPLTTSLTLEPPLIPSGASLFAPTLAPQLAPPFIMSGASLFAPLLANPAPQVDPPVVDPADPDVIPLVRALSLPLPNSLTRVKGIHQSDIIIRSAVTAALADMRANPWLLDYVFASLPQDALTWKEYGEKDLTQAKKWFLSTNVPVSVLPRLDEGKFPQVTIELQESSEVVPEAIVGDINYEPSEDNDMTWPALTPQFTPISYTPSTGIVRLSKDLEPLVAKGMFLVDRLGVAHQIVDVTSQTRFKLTPGTIADLRKCVLKGHRPNWKVDIESSSFKESYRIGIHISGEPAHLTWLHAIVQFALLRYKQVLMEARGFERSTISSSQVARAEWSEAENVFSRYITITGYVRQFWPKTIAQVIDGVQFEGLQVSGQGADVQMEGSGTDPEDSLWIGNLDSLRTRR